MSTETPKPPYISNPGTLAKVLDQIKEAATPQRFTQDFVSETLGFKGGYALAVIPYLKRIGFLASDGSPTETYKRFRNDGESGFAVGEAMRLGYASLFSKNEKAQELGPEQLKGLIVQVTGGKKDDSTTKFIFQCFNILKGRAVFESPVPARILKEAKAETASQGPVPQMQHREEGGRIGMNLSYTINLNLPASTDIAVFNAIFQSLRRNLLRDE